MLASIGSALGSENLHGLRLLQHGAQLVNLATGPRNLCPLMLIVGIISH